MAERGDFLHEERAALRQLRDELRVQAGLGKAELRDLYEDVERKWYELEGRLKVLGENMKGDVADVRSAALLLAEEVRKGFEHIRSRL